MPDVMACRSLGQTQHAKQPCFEDTDQQTNWEGYDNHGAAVARLKDARAASKELWMEVKCLELVEGD